MHSNILSLKFVHRNHSWTKKLNKLTPLAFLLHLMLVMASPSSPSSAPAVGHVTTLVSLPGSNSSSMSLYVLVPLLGWDEDRSPDSDTPAPGWEPPPVPSLSSTQTKNVWRTVYRCRFSSVIMSLFHNIQNSYFKTAANHSKIYYYIKRHDSTSLHCANSANSCHLIHMLVLLIL